MNRGVNAEIIRRDIKQQLSIPDDLDWDYLLETAMRGKLKSDKDGVNTSESPRTILQIIEDAKCLSDESAMTKRVDVIRQDLKRTLSIEGELDWDYLLEMTMHGKWESEKACVNMVEGQRTIEQIIEEAEFLSEE